MGKWLRKAGKSLKKIAHKYGDAIVEQAQEQISEKIGDVDWGDAISSITEKGQQCAIASRETIAVCESTATKREQMIAFGSEIQATLSNMGDASVLETIKKLTAGEKIQEAVELAQGLDTAAMTCVDKSKEMLDLMEDGMESLPPLVKSALEKMTDDDDEEEDELVRGIEADVNDIMSCVEHIKNFNLSTALKIGLEAFSQLTQKAERSQTLFDSIKGFATDVTEICDTFQSMDIASVRSKAKELLHCIGLCDVMRQVAEGAGKLLKTLIRLFEATADRISALWAGLAFAKDCMEESVDTVKEARELCLDAKTKSSNLIEKSQAVHDNLDSIGSINAESLRAIQDLTEGGEIQAAIDLVTNMDDVVLNCASKVTSMVDRVKEGFQNIPTILTEGMEMSVEGKQASDPEPINVESDVYELDEARRAIEDADVVTMVLAGRRGFEGVSDKASVCESALGLIQEFTSQCSGTIDSFLSVWDLESAGSKIAEMCRMVHLGELIQSFAQQVKHLLMGILSLLKAAMAKLSQGFPGFKAGVGEAVDLAKHKMEEAVDEAKEKMGDAVGNLAGKLSKLF